MYMLLKPDLTRPIIDPFNSHTTLHILCDILNALNKDPFERDPSGTAKKAEAYLKKTGIIFKSYFDHEPGFFLLDDVIFNGTKSRKPVGFCEVSINIQTNRGVLP